jgi:hypothetical protein
MWADKEEQMQDISRRGFLKVARNGIAAAGLVAVAPTALVATAGAATKPASKSAPTVRPVSSKENLVIHVPNPSTGEIHFMVGTREVVRHDRALVARLVRDVS